MTQPSSQQASQDPNDVWAHGFAAGRQRADDDLTLEIERLRGIIGRLYMARGGQRWDLYLGIKRAFRESQPTSAMTGNEE